MSQTSRLSLFPALALLTLFRPSGALAGEELWQIDKFWSSPKKPMVDLTGGISSVRHRLFQGVLDESPSLQLKLGYARVRPKNTDIVDLSDRYLFVDYSSSKFLGRTAGAAKVGAEILRFGSGGRSGYAYDFTSSYLYPYTQTTLQWARVNTWRPSGLSAVDAAVLDRYEDAFRFSTSAEAGLAFGFSDLLALRAGYEVTAIYPRHVFWPWVGSYGIAMIGMGAVSGFGDDIVKASPAAGPIVYTLLRSGLAYGYYLLVRDNQYWPFSSETPLTTDGFKVGVTITF